jgi:tetratricopeptide (TPR) repeat protein
MSLSPDEKTLIGPAESGSAIAVWDFETRRLKRIVPVFRGHSICSLAISPDGTRAAVGACLSPSIEIWDLRRGKLLVSLSGHTGSVRSLAWTPDGAALVSSSEDGTVRIWDSRTNHDFDAEIALHNLGDCCRLVEEEIQKLREDRALRPEVRRSAIELATRAGNARSYSLVVEAWQTGAVRTRSSQEYRRALGWAAVAAEEDPWYALGQLTLALLQYRTGDYENALRSADRAIAIHKLQGANAHAVRAMAYYQLHDLTRARAEVALARQAKERKDDERSRLAPGVFESGLVQEAEALLSPGPRVD